MNKLLIGYVALLWPILAIADMAIFVPNNLATNAGNADNIYPFLIRYGGISSMRYQQVYAAAQFAGVGEGQFITDLMFRPDAGAITPTSIITNIQVNLSVTSKAPDELSALFADNVGTNDTVVYGPKALNLGTGNPIGNFVIISLDVPFFYEPSAGNLLMDVRNFTGDRISPINFPRLDAQSLTGDSVSRVYSEDVGAKLATVADTTGLVTRFQVSGIPQLTNTPASNAVVISWSRQPPQFVFQSADSIGPQAVWRPITNGISDNLSWRWYTNRFDTAKPVQFFRLMCETCRTN